MCAKIHTHLPCVFVRFQLVQLEIMVLYCIHQLHLVVELIAQTYSREWLRVVVSDIPDLDASWSLTVTDTADIRQYTHWAYVLAIHQHI